MSKTEQFLLVLLFVLFLAYIWGIPKDETFNAVVTLLGVGIGAGILIENTRKRKKK